MSLTCFLFPCSNKNTVQCGAVAQSALIGLNCVPVIVNA
jgi:hypothetical protein